MNDINATCRFSEVRKVAEFQIEKGTPDENYPVNTQSPFNMDPLADRDSKQAQAGWNSDCAFERDSQTYPKYLSYLLQVII